MLSYHTQKFTEYLKEGKTLQDYPPCCFSIFNVHTNHLWSFLNMAFHSADLELGLIYCISKKLSHDVMLLI